jgi:hypothetical protein
MGEYIHGSIRAEGVEPITFAYGPILPDSESRQETNRLLREKKLVLECKGIVLPQKKEFKKISVCPDRVGLSNESDGFSHGFHTDTIIRIENSGSDRRAIKIKSEKESKLRLPRLEGEVQRRQTKEPVYFAGYELDELAADAQ